MVDRCGGQLYTIEGFAAALIMVATAWIVIGTTSIYTPGDTHISDMQLEQLGNDILLTMDTPNNSAAPFRSPLQTFVENKDGDGAALFNNMFLSYSSNKTGGAYDDIQYIAWVSYRKGNETAMYEFSKSRSLTPGDRAVRVTRWVLVDNRLPAPMPPAGMPVEVENREQAVLVEVLLWKG
ncbi:MAG: hypothetical protein A4E35_01247 [Methanoregula sp. PtaU1.Bin051]|nr:MAG: hypothetical protein A4E35_01247 [Methanoregula sp. PtaU1.Bin051]